ncbi:MAG: hypothetical protein PHE83_11885 [Opitutaceae bacterium]|nr:hypothetical protein [Opitutaceae bacterium]
MLLAVAAGAGAGALAILSPPPPAHQNEVAWSLAIVVAVLSATIAGTAHFKIGADHKIYANFGTEYMRTSELLGFYSSSSSPLKVSHIIGQGTGYRKTQWIIWAFAGVVTLLALLFAVWFNCLR